MDGDPYLELEYFILLYEDLRIGVYFDIIGYDLIEKYSSK